jgi:hypothetical protein
MPDSSALDAVYRERQHLLAHLAASYPSVLVDGADREAPSWPVLFVKLPTGQVSWHIGPDDRDLFPHVERAVGGMPGAPIWDGHDTAEKYRRLDAHTLALTAEES